MLKRISIPTLAFLLLSIALSACQFPNPLATQPADEYKLAAIFPGVITDADYNTLGYIGITELERHLDIPTSYQENISVSAAGDVMREFIASGNNVIWAHGGQFVDETVAMARQYPSVIFIGEGDDAVPDAPANFWFIDRNYQVGFYVIGATAALSTHTGKIGYLGGPRLPLTYSEVHAIQQAIHDLGLDGKVELVSDWVGDFNDPTAAHRLAGEMIGEGVDFIMGSLNLGMYGAFEAVKEARDQPIRITAKYMDKSAFAPQNYVTSLLYDFSTPLIGILLRIQEGETGGYYPLGFSGGESIQLPLMNVDPTVEMQVKDLLKQVMEGQIQIVKDTSPVP